MSPEKQRIAIAEACGWKDICMNRQDPDLGATGYNTKTDDYDYLPVYPADLNAMHEAEMTLVTHQLCYEYNNKLYNLLGNVVGGRTDKPHHWTWHATAAQRAEAFLRTIGKWEDKP